MKQKWRRLEMSKFSVSVTVYHKTFEVEAETEAEVRNNLEFYDWGMGVAIADIEELDDEGWFDSRSLAAIDNTGAHSMKNVYIVKTPDDVLEVYSTKKKAVEAVKAIAEVQGRTVTETRTYTYLLTFWDDCEQIAEIRIEPVL
jgi:hypothetical protein